MKISFYYDDVCQMIHDDNDCGGIVMADKDGSLGCVKCHATQPPDGEDDPDIMDVSTVKNTDLFDDNDEIEFVVTRFIIGRIDQDELALAGEVEGLTAAFHNALENAGLELVPGKDPYTEVIPDVVRPSVTLMVRGAVMIKDQADG